MLDDWETLSPAAIPLAEFKELPEEHDVWANGSRLVGGTIHNLHKHLVRGMEKIATFDILPQAVHVTVLPGTYNTCKDLLVEGAQIATVLLHHQGQFILISAKARGQS